MRASYIPLFVSADPHVLAGAWTTTQGDRIAPILLPVWTQDTPLGVLGVWDKLHIL